MWNEKIGRKRVHNAGRWSLAVYKFICMRIKRNVNAITRAICEHVKEHLSMKMWRGYVTNTRRLTIIFALVDGLVVFINWRLMENVQDIERLLALGPNVIESTTITKVNCCYILTRIMGGFIVCSIILLVASCVLTLCNLDKYLITINNNRFDHLHGCNARGGATSREKISKMSASLSCIFDTREHWKTIVRFFREYRIGTFVIDGCLWSKILRFSE